MMQRGIDRRGMLSAAALGVIGGLAPRLAWAAGAADAKPTAAIRTVHGPVRGLRIGDVDVFRGIRYGASTAGENRFKAPAPPAPWREIFDASVNGPQCPQRSIRPDEQAASAAILANEDCLRLNVFTPACDNARRAVMVWFHGGFYVTGSGNDAVYDGSALARGGDVVVVSVTHRINLFGYLHLDPTAGDFGQAANPGQLDLVLALQWVRDNIERFGGDPERVTIFGESGGGRKASVLMNMPSAKGLFQQAIVQSGAGVTVSAPEFQNQLARQVLAELGIARNEQKRLQEVPVDRLLAAHSKVLQSDHGLFNMQPGFLYGGFSPVRDGRVVPGDPFTPAAPAQAAGVRLLIGTNRDESATSLISDPANKALTEDQLRSRMAIAAGDRVDEVLARYRDDMPGADRLGLLIAFDTDRNYWINAIRMAERKAAQPAPVYMYRFDWPSPSLGRPAAFHGLDVAYVFNNLDAAGRYIEPTAASRQVAATMSRSWLAFANTGKPGHDGIPDWPAYEPVRRTTMHIGAQWALVDKPRDWARQIWAQLAP